MPVSDDDLHAQEPTSVSHPGRPDDDLEAKAAAARAESEGPEFDEQTPDDTAGTDPVEADDEADASATE